MTSATNLTENIKCVTASIARLKSGNNARGRSSSEKSKTEDKSEQANRGTFLGLVCCLGASWETFVEDLFLELLIEVTTKLKTCPKALELLPTTLNILCRQLISIMVSEANNGQIIEIKNLKQQTIKVMKDFMLTDSDWDSMYNSYVDDHNSTEWIHGNQQTLRIFQELVRDENSFDEEKRQKLLGIRNEYKKNETCIAVLQKLHQSHELNEEEKERVEEKWNGKLFKDFDHTQKDLACRLIQLKDIPLADHCKLYGYTLVANNSGGKQTHISKLFGLFDIKSEMQAMKTNEASKKIHKTKLEECFSSKHFQSLEKKLQLRNRAAHLFPNATALNERVKMYENLTESKFYKPFYNNNINNDDKIVKVNVDTIKEFIQDIRKVAKILEKFKADVISKISETKTHNVESLNDLSPLDEVVEDVFDGAEFVLQ